MTAAVPGLTVRVRADRPSAVHLRAEIDLEVLGVVKDVEEGAALVKLGDAEEKKKINKTTEHDGCNAEAE